MLRDALVAESCYLPCTGNRYVVYQDGIVRDTQYDKIIPYFFEDGKEMIVIEHFDMKMTLVKNLVIALAFKNFRVPFKFWNLLGAKTIDGLRSPYAPDNLIITVPDGGIESEEYPGFYYVPGFTDYVVSKEEDRIIRLSLHKEIKVQVYGTYASTKSMEGYRFIRAVDDLGISRSLGLHRAKGLAVIPYPVNVDKLDVNHKDTDKTNNHYKNLEWRSRRGNNLHATEMGKRPDNHAIEVINVYTKEVRKYFSLWECARWLGVHAHYVKKSADGRGLLLLEPGVLIKRVSDRVEWSEEYISLAAEDGKYRQVRLLTLTNAQTNEPMRSFMTSYGLNKYMEEYKDEIDYNPKVVIKQLTAEEACKSFFDEKQRSHIT